MEETQAVSSPAAVETPSTFAIPRSGTTEYAEWRVSGELPDKPSPKIADTATADTSKETTSEEPADSAATQTQEQRQGKRRPDVEARIKLLTDKTKELEAQLAEARRPKETKTAESSTAKPVQTYKDWRAQFKPSQWIEQYGKDHPDHSYEDANAAMADYLGDVRDQFRSIEQQRQSQANELNSKVTDARARYGESFDQILKPTVDAIVNDQTVSRDVKARLNRSKVLPDLIFTLGSDAKTLAAFQEQARTDPWGAIDYIVLTESLIQEELAKGGKGNAESGRNDKGQFTAKAEPAPAKRGPESAPEPPIEIGSRGAGTMDESSRALQSIERGDGKAFRQWKAAEDRKALARRRGA